MKQALSKIVLVLALAVVSVWALPALAEEGAAASAEEGKKEGGGEGGEKEGGKKKDDDISGGRFAGDPVYVHITPLMLPVISDEGLQQLVTVVIDVEVKDFDTADMMHTNMPRIRDALMRSLYGGLGQGTLRNGKLINVTKIKTKATVALNEVVGNNGIKEVLVQGVAQRMF
jgi:flagellar basal body-associated protein FliL